MKAYLTKLFNDLKNPFNYDVEHDIPDLSSKVIIVTGGNSGIGQASVLEFAKHNPKRLYLCARTKQKFDATATEIRKSAPNAKLYFLPLDLASLASVNDAAETVIAENDSLDILMNNAGIMCAPHGLTKEGYEVHFGTNHMGHALLTRRLLPLLERTSKLPDSDVRIINTSSAGHNLARQGIPFTELQNEGASKHSLQLYGVSKLSNVLHAKKIAKLYPSIIAVSVHPGRAYTSLASDYKERRTFTSKVMWFSDQFVRVFTPQEGALNQLWAATGRREDIENGAYYIPIGHKGGNSVKSEDEKLVDDLWDWQEAEFERLGYI